MGYLTSTEITFTLSKDGTITNVNGGTLTETGILVMTDMVGGTVAISKQDMVNGKEISGAVITITADTGSIKDAKNTDNTTFVNDGTSITFTSNDAPTVIQGLANGTYTLQETTAPAGFQITETFTFEVQDGKVVDREDNQVIVKDMPNIVTISKTDIAGSKELDNAKLEITGTFHTGNITVKDADGNAPKELTITEDKISYITEGKSVSIYGIEDGTYQLTETSAPSGYETAETITFTVKNGKVANEEFPDNHVIMKDDYSKHDVTVSKKNIAGEEIEGATLTITQNDTEELIESWTSVKGESHIVKGLQPMTIYVLEETSAPNGYVKAEKLYFIIDLTGSIFTSATDDETSFMNTVQSLTMVDKYDEQSVTISKQNISGEEIENAQLQVYTIEEFTKSEGTKTTVDSWISVENQSHEITGLMVNQVYVLEETTAPEGYEKAEHIYFKVIDEKGTVQVSENGVDFENVDSNIVVMVDEAKPVETTTSTSETTTTESATTSDTVATTTESATTSDTVATTTESATTSDTVATTTESTSTSATEATTTESTSTSATEATTTESTSTSATEATTTESTSTSATEATTTESTSTSTTEATTTESTSTSTTVATTTESTSTSTTEATTTESATTSTTVATTTESATTSTTEATTTESATTSTTEATTTETATTSTTEATTAESATTSTSTTVATTTESATTSTTEATTTESTTTSITEETTTTTTSPVTKNFSYVMEDLIFEGSGRVSLRENETTVIKLDSFSDEIEIISEVPGFVTVTLDYPDFSVTSHQKDTPFEISLRDNQSNETLTITFITGSSGEIATTTADETAKTATEETTAITDISISTVATNETKVTGTSISTESISEGNDATAPSTNATNDSKEW
ncbi:MAG: SpaA isopeptide-forming pilin-related protein [Oscillospiraceae bacterium]